MKMVLPSTLLFLLLSFNADAAVVFSQPGSNCREPAQR